MKRKAGIIIALLAATGLTVGAYYSRRSDTAPEVITGAVSRGEIVTEIASTGTLEAVTTVQVGTQVSGTIQALYADFNSIVRKGQVIARLDPSLFQTQVESARASLASAEADLQRMRVALEDATTKATRAHELAAKQLIPQADVDAADVAQRSAAAQVKSEEAQLSQARASLTQAQVNLQKTVIVAPIDGIVIARSVDVGQTVASSLQAPTLFTLAADLREMQVNANIDESDLGAIKQGQSVNFRVDAYPNRQFTGKVEQVRLDPVVQQNVVTYAAIISAANPALELKPGMTANVSIEVARRDDVLRVPSAALRFKPSDVQLAALGQDPKLLAQQNGAAKPKTGSKSSTVWVYDGGLHPNAVRTGVSDGAFTEIVDGSLKEGDTVATRMADTPGGATPARTSGTANGNPLMPQQGPPRRF